MNQRRHASSERLATQPILTSFLNEAGDFDLLSKEDEAELFPIINRALELYQSLPNLNNLSSDQEAILMRAAAAQQVIFLTNQRLVFNLAKRHSYGDENWLMDLTQQGMLGLSKSIARFDSTTGNAFSTYATWWVRQEITRYIADKSRTIRLPVHMHEKFVKATSIVKGMSLNLNREPTKQEIEQATGLTITEYKKLMQHGSNTPYSLDGQVNSDIDLVLGATVADPNADIDRHVDHISDIEELRQLLITSDLSDREKFVVGLRFELTGDYFDDLVISVGNRTVTYKAASALMSDINSTTLESVGKLFGVSRERIRQIEKEGVKGLQRAHQSIKRGQRS